MITRKPMQMSQGEMSKLMQGGKAVEFEMDDERREKFRRVSNEIVNLLRANCPTPPEAYMLLCFIMDGFEGTYGIRGGIVLDHEDTKRRD